MMISRLFSCVLLVATAPAAAPSKPAAPAAAKTAPAVKDDADAWATKVQKAYVAVTDLSAEFEQVSTFSGGTKGPKQTGTIEVKKPGKMRWEFVTPEKKSMVSDGKTMWIYDAEENQVMVNEHMQQTTSVTGLNFLEGLGDLKKSFTYSIVSAPADATAKNAVFLNLVPKDLEDVQFTSILLAVDPKTNLASEVFLTDAMGSVTRLTLTNLTKNKALADSRFVFEIPKNAEVIKPQLLQ